MFLEIRTQKVTNKTIICFANFPESQNLGRIKTQGTVLLAVWGPRAGIAVALNVCLPLLVLFSLPAEWGVVLAAA